MGTPSKVKTTLLWVALLLGVILSALLIWQIALVGVGFGIRAEQRREQADREERRTAILPQARQELTEVFDREWTSYQNTRLGIVFRYPSGWRAEEGRYDEKNDLQNFLIRPRPPVGDAVTVAVRIEKILPPNSMRAQSFASWQQKYFPESSVETTETGSQLTKANGEIMVFREGRSPLEVYGFYFVPDSGKDALNYEPVFRKIIESF